jgi:1-deoxy-D-xylulose-5-phosphate synthase
MLHDALALSDSGPVVIRYPKGIARSAGEHEVGAGIAARKVRTDNGARVCILAVGKLVGVALDAAATLSSRGIGVTVWDVRSCAPLDESMLDDAARHEVVITVEDGIRDGGIGMTIEDVLASRDGAHPQVRVLGLPTRFIPQAKPDVILSSLGLDARGIVATADGMLT